MEVAGIWLKRTDWLEVQYKERDGSAPPLFRSLQICPPCIQVA